METRSIFAKMLKINEIPGKSAKFQIILVVASKLWGEIFSKTNNMFQILSRRDMSKKNGGTRLI